VAERIAISVPDGTADRIRKVADRSQHRLPGESHIKHTTWAGRVVMAELEQLEATLTTEAQEQP